MSVATPVDRHWRVQSLTHISDSVDEHVREEAQAHEKSGERPTVELIQKMGSDGININAMRLGPGKLLHGLNLPAGLDGKEFDYFHELVVTQELVRAGARGYADGLQGGMVIGCARFPDVRLPFSSDTTNAACRQS